MTKRILFCSYREKSNLLTCSSVRSVAKQKNVLLHFSMISLIFLTLLIKVLPYFWFVDATIIGLRSEIAKLLSCAEELEIMRHFKTEFEKTESENAR